MMDWLDIICNAFLKVRFYIATTLGWLQDYTKVKEPAGFVLVPEKCEDFSKFYQSGLGDRPAWKYEDTYGTQWVKPHWTPCMKRWDWVYPWRTNLEGDVAEVSKDCIALNRGILNLSVGYDKEHEKWLCGMLYSNFTIGAGNVAEVIAQMPKAKNMSAALWFGGDPVYEPDLIEWFGGDKNHFLATLHMGLEYHKGPKAKWMSRFNRIIGGKAFWPDDQFYNYRIEINPVGNKIKYYINGMLIRQFHRASTTPLNVIMSTGICKDRMPSEEELKQYPDSLQVKSFKVWRNPLRSTET
jgi:hypothetical protein